ncbi:dihydropyrimidinase/allantoinase [Devosia sp. YR412]|uniref:dihydroorotase n=1 Tax=Devosia sp. YR412 TaxID=1881030 RepID=UPI0008D3529E|nr:dihydroorotase family protein [Devosia sp. YR412]SEQ40735.1 dihydropyrimidinase/allantoinase [Devosia sp. YR412]
MTASYDSVIRGAKVLTPEGLLDLDVGIAGGRIAALLPRGEGNATITIDGSGQHLLPGAIDIHFHVRAPAFPERGTVESETRAAAAGGVTTLFEMPISKPCCNSAERVEIRRAHFAEHAFINFGLYAAPGDLTDTSVEAMRAAGIVAFKIFTTVAPEGRDDEFFGLSFPDEGDQLRALKAAAKTGLPIVVHAESAQIIAAGEADLVGRDLADADTHLDARPAMAEAVAVAKLLTMNIAARAKLHIAHVTSALTVDVLRRFAGTSDFSAETCPHYLFRTHDDVRKAGVFAKINPPVRNQSDQDALWQAIADGIITHVTTDHAAFSFADKQASIANWLNAPPGTPGSEILLPSMLDAVAQGKVTLEQAMALLSGNAADRFSLAGKGRIAVGADADLVLVDMAGTTEITPQTLFTHARDVAQLYYGARFACRVTQTLVAGRTVFDGGIVGEAGWGRYTSPSTTTRAASAAMRA